MQNSLPNGMEWSENDKKNFVGTHWSYDLGFVKYYKFLIIFSLI